MYKQRVHASAQSCERYGFSASSSESEDDEEEGSSFLTAAASKSACAPRMRSEPVPGLAAAGIAPGVEYAFALKTPICWYKRFLESAHS